MLTRRLLPTADRSVTMWPVETPESLAAEREPQPRGHWSIWSRPPLLWVRVGYLTAAQCASSARSTALSAPTTGSGTGCPSAPARGSKRSAGCTRTSCAPGEEARSRVQALPCRQRSRIPDPGARRVPGDDQGELRDAVPVRRALPRRPDPDRGHGRGRVRRLLGHAVQLAALGSGAPRRAPEHRELDPTHLPDRAPVRDQCLLDGRVGDGARTWASRSRGSRWSSRPARTSRRSSTRSSSSAPSSTTSITAYPPFLKHLVDALDERGFDWTRTRVYGAVGRRGDDRGDARLPRAALRRRSAPATAPRTSRSGSPARPTCRSGCASCS